MGDIRDDIFRGAADKRITASIIADDGGLVAETAAAAEEAERLGLAVEKVLDEGTRVKSGDEIMRFSGTPKQVALAEEVLIGLMAKPSGIATAARDFVEVSGEKLQVVCGAWKKMPPSCKEAVRRAVAAGGAYYRITREPFVYLDKNYVEMLGGIKESLVAVSHLADRVKVVQLKGKHEDIVKEAFEAIECGADILFVDTGVPFDFLAVAFELRQAGLRDKVKIAFGGELDLNVAGMIRKEKMDVDILDVGRSIVDAPLLDMRLEVVAVEGGGGGEG
jgi:nicotinate-nucleotide pyrophosphorylase (carboxylating)